MEWMLLPLRRYAKFSGRSRPKEYWMFILFLILFFPIIGSLVLLVFFIMSGTRGPNRFGPDPVEAGEPELAKG